MSPAEAVEYGIIDNIFNKRPVNPVWSIYKKLNKFIHLK